MPNENPPETIAQYCEAISEKINRIKELLAKGPEVPDIQPDPTNVHIIAHVPDVKEIDKTFKLFPWCHWINARGRVMVSRKVWEKISNKDKEAYVIE